MSSKDYMPYEKWSRNDYRMAYEEADKLLKETVAERNALREKQKLFDSALNSANASFSHSLVLGRVIDRLLNKA